MQTMTEQQRIKDEDRRSREAEKSFNDAFIKGDGRAYCFGKMSVFPGQHSLPWLYIVIPDKNLDYTDQGIQHIKWSCDSVFGRLSNFIINILILISFPLLLPTVTLAVIAVSRWIKAGFK
jgi:hypothetical protein